MTIFEGDFFGSVFLSFLSHKCSESHLKLPCKAIVMPSNTISILNPPNLVIYGSIY